MTMRQIRPRAASPGRRVIRLGLRTDPGALTVLVVSSLLRTIAMLALPVVSGRALDGLIHRHAGDGSGRADQWVQTSMVLLVLTAVAEAAGAWAGTALGAATTWRIRNLMVRHTLAVGPRMGRSFGTADVVSRATGNAGQAGTAVVTVIGAVAGALPALGAVVLLLLVDPWCGVVFAAGLGLLIFALRKLVHTGSAVTTAYLAAQTGIAAGLAEAVQGARTIAAAGTVAAERRRVLRPLPLLSLHGRALWAAQSGAVVRTASLLPVVATVCTVIAGWQLTERTITVGEFFAVTGYLALGSQINRSLTASLAIGQARAAADRCAAVLDVAPTGYGTAERSAGGGVVTFVDVWLGEGPDAILRGIDVRIPARQHVAVVGRSGSGKTAFAALIGRLLEPDRGVVCLDGEPVRDLSAEAVHRSVAYAFTRPALVGGTIRGTIALGSKDFDDDVIAAAATDACAATFISRLPEGYGTALADAPMSGGEMQRLGLARAFAHPGPVLVMDDATSSLDTVTEHQIWTALGAGRPRTRIVVAHRVGTAQRADRVLWIDEGGIRADGPHSVLWADPDYRALFASAPAEPAAAR